MDYLSPDEVERLLAACDSDFYPLLATAILTGMRQGEQLALTWADIDLSRGVIYVRRSLDQKHGITSTKTIRSQRAVTMTPQLKSILAECKDRSGAGADDLVFANDGRHIAAGNMVRDRFWPLLERAGLRRIRWHDLRHSYASLMISNNANIKFVSQQLGHTSTRTTWDIYGHLLPEPGQEAGQKLDALIFNGKVSHFPASKSKDA
jgi:integrase